MSLLDMLQYQLAGEPAAQIGRQLGTDQAGAQKAIGAALPALMAALAGNAARKEGASALASALEKRHDGRFLNDLSGFLSQGDTKDGEGILQRALGARRAAVESEVAKQTGLDIGGLAGMLSGEGKRAKEMAPGALGALGMLGGLLDNEGDGIDASDLADAGKKLLGGFLGGRK